MAWIKFEKDLLTDPRVLRIAKTLSARWTLDQTMVAGEGYEVGNSEALPAVTLVCGALVRIWSLADTHIDPNNVLPLGVEELNEVVGIPGFCELLPVDWLNPIDEHSVELPEYHAHNGTEAKKRAVTQKRVSRFRDRALQDRNGPALPDQTKTRPRPEEKKSPPLSKKSKTQLPPDFAVSDRVNAWALGKGFDRLDEHLDAFKRKCAAKGYTNIDWDAAFMEAVREDWAKLRGGVRTGQAPAPAPIADGKINCRACGNRVTAHSNYICTPCNRAGDTARAP